MLEELEKLSVELGKALPKIVVTCSTESSSMKRMERDAAAAAVNSSELLRSPPAVGDESSVVYDVGTGLSLAKEKNRIFDPERGTEEPSVRPSQPSSVAVSSPPEKSLTCLAPEFLSGSLTSSVLQPAHGFHSKPAQTIQCLHRRAFLSALKEPQPTSSITKRLIMPHSTKTESESRAAIGTASEALSPYFTASPARSKCHTQARAAKSKSAARHNRNNSIKRLALRIMRHTPRRTTTAQRRQPSQVKWYRYGCERPSTST